MNSLFKTVTASQSTGLKRTPSDDVLTFNAVQTSKQTIHIRDLELEMTIGVMDTEKVEKQKVVVNTEIEITPNTKWSDDNIQTVVSYADIADIIQAISNGPHMELVETFAHKIIEASFAHSRQIVAMSVTIDKPEIMNNTKSVGCTISKQRINQ